MMDGLRLLLCGLLQAAGRLAARGPRWRTGDSAACVWLADTQLVCRVTLHGAWLRRQQVVACLVAVASLAFGLY
jgi:hypothetical protein